jgi:hypothetical protein
MFFTVEKSDHIPLDKLPLNIIMRSPQNLFA